MIPIIVYVLATGVLQWQPMDSGRCQQIASGLERGRVGGLTLSDGSRLRVVAAHCLTKDQAARIYGFEKGMGI